MPRTSAVATAQATNIPRPDAVVRATTPKPAAERAAPGEPRTPAVTAVTVAARPPAAGRASGPAGRPRRGGAGAGGASSGVAGNGAPAGKGKGAASPRRSGSSARSAASLRAGSNGKPAAKSKAAAKQGAIRNGVAGRKGKAGAGAKRARSDGAPAARKPATKSARAAAPAKIERKTVAMLALERVRERILHGDYPEGSPLRQDALAAELGVSRIPVREALRQLEAEGLVSFSPHVGAVVSSLSLDDIKELFDLRALLESELLRRAIAHMHEDDLEQAAAVLAEYRAAFRRRDVAAWGALNREFHAALLRPAGQPLTMAILQNLLNQSDRYTRLQLTLTHGEDRAREEHSAILDAVRDCDAQRACALLASHILGAGRSLLEFLRSERGLGSHAEGR